MYGWRCLPIAGFNYAASHYQAFHFSHPYPNRNCCWYAPVSSFPSFHGDFRCLPHACRLVAFEARVLCSSYLLKSRMLLLVRCSCMILLPFNCYPPGEVNCWPRYFRKLSACLGLLSLPVFLFCQ